MANGDAPQPERIRLQDLQIVARPRRHWEALDLGVLIARRWYALLLGSWLCLAGPLFVLLWIVIPDHPVWAMFILWWCKPLYERIPLRILSTAIFAATPGLKAALGEWRAAIVPGIAGALSYRRLTPTRSFAAPVWVLERLAGPARQKRLAILQARAGAGAWWLTVLGAHLEVALVLGLITGMYLFIPGSMEVDWWGLLASGSQGELDWLVNLVCLLAMAAVAPVYVAAGFALYLNRRVELEAWDIELGFRRLAQRAAAAVLLVLAAVVWLPAAEVRAESYPDDPVWGGPEPAMEVRSPRRQDSRDTINAVLAGPDFNEQRMLRYPKFLQTLFESRQDSQPDSDFGWLAGALRLLAGIAEVLLWAAVVALVLWLVYRTRIVDVISAARRNRPMQPPRQILGLAVDKQSLPDDVVRAAMGLWDSGGQREALGLIYRATLHSLIDRFHCELDVADTEGQCLSKARAVLPERGISYLQQLTRAWQFAAYAHALPDDAQFSQLCRTWPEIFAMDAADDS